jgi:hypothetical protein
MRVRKGARIFTHDESLFANCQKVGKGYGVLLEMSFSFFFSKNMDGEGIWGTLGDAGAFVYITMSSLEKDK